MIVGPGGSVQMPAYKNSRLADGADRSSQLSRAASASAANRIYSGGEAKGWC